MKSTLKIQLRILHQPKMSERLSETSPESFGPDSYGEFLIQDSMWQLKNK